jgi:ankyrin repeat protein
MRAEQVDHHGAALTAREEEVQVREAMARILLDVSLSSPDPHCGSGLAFSKARRRTVISKTRMLALVKDLRSMEVAAALAEKPELLTYRDDRGRSWLHLCCGVNPKSKKPKSADRVKTARALLDAGLDIDGEAFREGEWKATPLWYAVARGRCLPLARFLLERGADPNHCLWAAGFNEDVAMIKLLVAHGADIDPVTEGHTPFLGAVQWSRFRGARALLELGANVDFQNASGMTALHYMLKKGSDERHFRMLIQYRARGDIPNANGATAAEIMGRKRAPVFRKMAAELGME